ncbi:MAG: phosphotransferase [Xanthomonadales bacterium]
MNSVNWPAVEQAVQEHLAAHYDLRGRLTRLPGENLNYRVRSKDEEQFVCKIIEQGTPGLAAADEQRLLAAARTGGFPAELPYIQKTNTRKYETGITIPLKGVWTLRLMNYVHGTVLENQSDISIKTLKNTGEMLARFDRALTGFDHPSLHRTHRWDLAAAGRHREHLALIEKPAHRDLAVWAFQRWDAVRDELPALPRQVIHGDANPENLLTDGETITGLVDFGDSLFNPRVCEPAICIAYLMMGRDDPLAAAAAVVDGYASVIDLDPVERAVLLPLACGRLGVSVCVAAYRRTIDPGNANWFVSLAPALRLLEQLRETA